MKRKPETLQADEEWMIVALPRDTAKALISTVGMSGRKIPPNPITETGRLRGGVTVELGRAIGGLLARERDTAYTAQIQNVPSGECVGVPIIVNRNESDIFFGEDHIPGVLCALVTRDDGHVNANRSNRSATTRSTARSPALPDGGISSTEQAKPSRSPWKIASFTFLGIMALIGCMALVGVVINSVSASPRGVPVSNTGAAIPFNAEQPAPQTSSIAAPVTAPSAPLPPPSNLEVVLGGGGKRLFVFDDPLCPYCKRIEPSLRAMVKRGYEVHIFPTPIHDEARALVAGITCAKDKAAAWNDAINKETPFEGECDERDAAPDTALAFFRQFGFNATPTMINEAGRVKVGGFDSDDAMAAFIEEK